jgi:hypothetical protein
MPVFVHISKTRDGQRWAPEVTIDEFPPEEAGYDKAEGYVRSVEIPFDGEEDTLDALAVLRVDKGKAVERLIEELLYQLLPDFGKDA